jgi:hypothetical protein
MLNMGVYFRTGTRKVDLVVYNFRKPVIFRDIWYFWKVMFLQGIFEALNIVFSDSDLK